MKYKLADNTWDDKEYEAINRVINSNKFTMGDEVKKFEDEVSSKLGAKYAVMVNSGSSANLLAISALVYSNRLLKGDEVIVPAVSWSTTFFPLMQLGLKIKFIDISLDSLNINIDKVEKNISIKTKAIFTVNLLGNPNEFDILNDLCRSYNLILIEDNCESLGARYSGRFTGSFGVLGTFSMFFSHHLNTIEGGFVLTDDEELYHFMLSIRAHGWTRNLPKDSLIYSKSQDPFFESFNFILPGYNIRPIELEAAIGLAQLDKLDIIIKHRRENAQLFYQLFGNNNFFDIQTEIGESSWFGFSLILKKAYRGLRNNIVKILYDNEIEVRPIVAGNFTKNKAIKYLDYVIPENLENADVVHNEGFFIGNNSRDISCEIEYLFNVLNKYFK